MRWAIKAGRGPFTRYLARDRHMRVLATDKGWTELSGRGGGAGHHVVFSFIRLSLTHTSRQAHKHTPPQTGRHRKCEGMSMYLLRIRHVVRVDLKWQKQEQKQMPKTNAIGPGIQCLGLGFILYTFWSSLR